MLRVERRTSRRSSRARPRCDTGSGGGDVGRTNRYGCSDESARDRSLSASPVQKVYTLHGILGRSSHVQVGQGTIHLVKRLRLCGATRRHREDNCSHARASRSWRRSRSTSKSASQLHDLEGHWLEVLVRPRRMCTRLTTCHK